MPFLLLRKVFRPNALHHREREGEEGRKGRETERKGAGRRERRNAKFAGKSGMKEFEGREEQERSRGLRSGEEKEDRGGTKF